MVGMEGMGRWKRTEGQMFVFKGFHELMHRRVWDL